MMDIEKIIIGKVRTPKNGSGDIWDEENNHIADARGWGRFQYEDDGDKKHDFLANFIVDAINEKLDREQRGIVIVGDIGRVKPQELIVAIEKHGITTAAFSKIEEDIKEEIQQLEIKEMIVAKPFFLDKPRKSKKKRGGFGNRKKFI